MPGPNDLNAWLASLMPNAIAGQPYGVAGMPRYGMGPGDLGMADPRGLTAPTPGALSMGYPSLTPQPGQPQGSAGDDGGFNNPYQAAASAPAGAPAPPQLQASLSIDNPRGDGPPDVLSPEAMYQRQYGGPTAAADAAHPAPPAPFVQPQHPSTMRYPMWPTPPAPDSPAGSPSATPRSAKGPLASSSGAPSGAAPMKRTPGAPNLGYYQGNNNRFVQVDRPNASAAGGFGRGGAPQMTALNLAGLFGGRGQPAAAPAVNPSVPAANAQPVSASAPNAYPGDEGWDVDAQGNPIPSYGSADPIQMNSATLASAVSKPNWLQQFSTTEMNPDQLARAVRKPNWWRNV
jgi:hypothetical protein